jgi:hypothetical protein
MDRPKDGRQVGVSKRADRALDAAWAEALKLSYECLDEMPDGWKRIRDIPGCQSLHYRWVKQKCMEACGRGKMERRRVKLPNWPKAEYIYRPKSPVGRSTRNAAQ